MKILSTILIGLLAMSTVTFAQETNNEIKPQKPEIKKEVQKGPRGPMMHQGEFGGPRGPMFRGGRGPQGPRGPQAQVSPNDRPEEWEALLAARRAESLHKVNPTGPYPRGPMFRGGQERPIVIVIQCPCQQQGQKFQKRHQFRGGR